MKPKLVAVLVIFITAVVSATVLLAIGGANAATHAAIILTFSTSVITVAIALGQGAIEKSVDGKVDQLVSISSQAAYSAGVAAQAETEKKKRDD